MLKYIVNHHWIQIEAVMSAEVFKHIHSVTFIQHKLYNA